MSPQGAGSPVSVDHVWANARVLLPSGRVSAACQLGGDHLGPHLAELAILAVVVGPQMHPGPGWTAVSARADLAPFPDASFDLVVVEDIGQTDSSPARVLDEARRLCRPTGTVLVGFQSGLERLRQRLPASLRSPPAIVLVALPTVRRPAFLLRASDRDAARYFARRIAFAYREPGDAGVRARLRQTRSRVALLAPAGLALRGAPGRLTVLPGPEVSASQLQAVGDLVLGSWTALELPGRPPNRLAPLVVGHRRPTTGMVTVLLFRDGDRAPTVVAKLPRYSSNGTTMRREAAALEAVRRVLDGKVRDAVPRSLGLHDLDGTEVLLQTGIPGRHLVAETASGRPRPSALASQIELVLDWCLTMQAASYRTTIVDDALIAGRLEPLAAEGLAALDGDPGVGSLLDRALEQSRNLRGTSLPMVVCHGDYWAGNVLVNRGRVSGVVDWERATLEELPLWDLTKAVGSAAYHLDRYRSLPRRGPGALRDWGKLGPWTGVGDPQFAVGFRGAFVQHGWLADLSRTALTSAFERAQIPLGWLPVAVTMYLVRQVVQAADSPRSVAGWGSVLRALAVSPGTWADELNASNTLHLRPPDCHVRPPAHQRCRKGPSTS